MIWGALQLAAGWARNAISAVLGFIRQYPWQAAVIALCALSAVLLMRLHHAEAQRDTWHRAYDLRVDAEKKSAEAQKALNARIQTTYQEQADASQERFDASRDRVRDATDRFVSAHRLQPGQCQAGGSDPAPGSGDPGIPAPVPAGGDVVIASADVQRCADATRYAIAAHDWASGLIAAGVAR